MSRSQIQVSNMMTKTNLLLSALVLFMLFRQPETSRLFFEEIRKARPSKLDVPAPGTHACRADDLIASDNPGKIVAAIYRPCEVHNLLREDNQGLGESKPTGITWFFDHEEEDTILEEQHLLNADLFKFSIEMLARYGVNNRVLQIGGNNVEKYNLRGESYSSRFSGLVYIWPWATRERAGKINDYQMNHYLELLLKKSRDRSFGSLCEDDLLQYASGKMFMSDEQTNRRTICLDKWQFVHNNNSCLVIVPNRNPLINLGFGMGVTNADSSAEPESKLSRAKLEFPLIHPKFLIARGQRGNHVFEKNHTPLSASLAPKSAKAIPNVITIKMLKPLMNFLS